MIPISVTFHYNLSVFDLSVLVSVIHVQLQVQSCMICFSVIAHVVLYSIQTHTKIVFNHLKLSSNLFLFFKITAGYHKLNFTMLVHTLAKF